MGFPEWNNCVRNRRSRIAVSGMDRVEWNRWSGMEWDGGVEWNGRSGIGMGWQSGMGLRSPERVGKTSETSENVGGGLNEIWYMTTCTS